eukprot:3606319-Alexandrium_andersonii.AAC.1
MFTTVPNFRQWKRTPRQTGALAKTTWSAPKPARGSCALPARPTLSAAQDGRKSEPPSLLCDRFTACCR